tara:strand:- start:58 stop:1197 length:1140 start_codon:yes stop_codon:yes gene_type:complete
MELIDRVLLEWSYRCEKGYPNLNNKEDLKIFEKVFEIDLVHEINSQGFRPLEFSELRKRGGPRLKKVHSFIQTGKPFTNSQGEEVVLKYNNDAYAELFANADIQGLKDIGKSSINNFPFLKDLKGSNYSFNMLLKTPDFGGKGTGSGTKVEDENLYLLKEKLYQLIDSEGGAIKVKIDGQPTYIVAGAETQVGMPKSDFNLTNEEGKPIVFISHKKAGTKGASANDFIRWSGYTMYADNPEVIDFNNAIKKFLTDNNLDGLPNKTRFISPIKDSKLTQALIYGPEFGGAFSKDNVNIIIQGEVSFEPQADGTYLLTGGHILIPPQVPTGEYAPYLTAAYRGDRQMFGILNNEAIAMTKAVAQSASNVYELRNGDFVKIK